ncbi:NUDIX hydrolase [archaeon]|jgi:ADP-ribose pyrophosphatase YjhB (NUDIX family)|nr:NUDIX hydrolase [archaeon]MBT3731183.1 NUDIX hydrolase [archaeon]MBT4670063.1 NUDIX hydrolase [archaeon]MBT7052550.1 NUDIX hydrolase [archaeon]MBT7281449.1 NUDIX hydrolase [archaeon]
MEYKNPAPTSNIIIVNDKDEICLVKRNIEPHKGRVAIPGGFVDYDETVEEAAIRESKEETGLDVELVSILGVYSEPNRNPSKHTISTVFIAKALTKELDGDDEGIPFWESIENIKNTDLAFDHNKMFTDFLQWREDNKHTFWSRK